MQLANTDRSNRKSSIQYNSTPAHNISERNTASEHEKIMDEQLNSENTMQNQFSFYHNSVKKNQEAYFKHKGDANFKIGSNIDFILEPEQENLRTIADQINFNNNASPLTKTFSQGANENDKLFLKKSDTVRTEDPTTQSNIVQNNFHNNMIIGFIK